MKNIFAKTIALILIIVFSSFYLGCGEKQNETKQITGEFNYRLETGTRKDENGEEKSYKYYVITGLQVSSEDALKMKEGDFSTVKDHREIVIPDKKGDYPIEEIDASAFAGQIILQKVVVGKNIRKIGEGAFGGCTNLQEIELPFIGETYNAVGQKRVFSHIFGASHTGEGNTQITAKISSYTGEDGSSLIEGEDVSFYLPTSLKTVKVNGIVSENGKDVVVNNIPQNAFYGVTTLENVVLADTISEINTYAFYGCSSIKSFDLSNVKTIYDYAFSNCSSLKDVIFGENPKLETIYDYVFTNCSSLGKSVILNDEQSQLELPSSLKNLGAGAFSGCSSLKQVDASKSQITILKNKVFDSCTSLKKIILKSGTSAQAFALSNCTALKGSDNKYNAVNELGQYMFTTEPNVFGLNEF